MSNISNGRTLAEWLQWLEQLHPTTIELGLDRVKAVFNRLNLDLSEQQIIIVGGTNGKGSSVAMLERILNKANYTTATYTSPHLIYYNERVVVNGQMVSDDELCSAFARVEEARQEVSLTYFEFGTLAAFVVFAKQQPDFIILEVGLGGRLDAVNIVEPDVSILTNVALDHIDWLGDTREKIGFEKAGIFRAGKTAIYGESDMPISVQETADKLGTHLLRKGKDYQWQSAENSWNWIGRDLNGDELIYQNLPLTGFPIDNAAAVVQALQFIRAQISIDDIYQGLANLKVPGRFQETQYQGIRVILDVAHNPHAAAHLASQMQQLNADGRVHLVIAMLGDKDSESVAKTLVAHAAQIYVAALPGERGAPGKIIYNHALAAGAESVSNFDTVPEAFTAAVQRVRNNCSISADSTNSTDGLKQAQLAQKDEIIVVTGSFFTVGAVLELI